MSADLTFPWAREYDADQLAAFIEDLWGAASGDNDLATLDAIEKVIAEHAPDPVQCPLTERELDILTELASGETKESAGRKLGLSTETVRARCQQIYARLDAKNIAHAAAIAERHGWLAGLRMPVPVEEPPVRLGRAWARRHQQHAADLRRLPGSQLPIGPYTSYNGARNAARCIRRGVYQPFEPAGSFDAEPVRANGGWIVLARFIGTPTTTTERQAS
ncbi:response regulator transcription factor [Streptomyces sp. NPDC002523]